MLIHQFKKINNIVSSNIFIYRNMANNCNVVSHYGEGSLMNKILDGLTKSGINIELIRIKDLHPVDQFHIGGLPAIEHLISKFNPSLLTTSTRILDIGCGLGGTTRSIKEKINNSIVHGIDITPEYIDVSRELTSMIGMNDITYEIGSATELPLEDNSFDIVMLIHVGMNIKDKEKMFKEAFRVLKTGGYFAIFDVMYEIDNDDSKLLFPLPWATELSQSFVTLPNEYKKSAINTGFLLNYENNRGDFARDFFNKMTTKAKTLGGPPPLSLPMITFGTNGLNKMKNIVKLLNSNVLAPVEMIFEKK